MSLAFDRRLVPFVLLVTIGSPSFFGGHLLTAADQVESRDASTARSLISRWDLGDDLSERWKTVGDVIAGEDGPRPPLYPNFDPDNRSARLNGDGARVVIPDPGVDSPYDFTNGDAITLQAYVRVDKISDGQNVYLIGKGRTGNERYHPDNQNWALRLRHVGGRTRLSFLFATPPETSRSKGKRNQHWHRWTSNEGLPEDGRWHAVAVSYRFGDPESIRGWIDGQSQPGEWDMGGPTKEAPVVDDDAVWIGSSMSGKDSSSFRGWIDQVSLRRELADDEEIAASWKALPIPLTPPSTRVIPGSVSVTIDPAVEENDDWTAVNVRNARAEMSPDMLPPLALPAFLLPRIPNCYDEVGVRDDWDGPVVLRMTADVDLPAGASDLLVRARGMTRLWVDEEVVAEFGPPPPGKAGTAPVTPLPEPPLPGARIARVGTREAFASLQRDQAGTVRIVLETLVGSGYLRVETGETLVALHHPAWNQFELLGPAGAEHSPRPLTDAAIEPALDNFETLLRQYDRSNRRRAAASQDAFWDARHALARRWVEQASSNSDGPASIDGFLEAKRRQASVGREGRPGDAEAAGLFEDDVLPILRENCFRCHKESGEGGLQLHTRQSMLAGGDSGEPAVVPGDPHAGTLLARIKTDDEFEQMPPSEPLSKKQIETLTRWVTEGAKWTKRSKPGQAVVPPPVDDFAFIRRVYLDTIGVPPTSEQIRHFVADDDLNKRARLVDQLLEDPRVADQWISYWLDVLAENPNLLRPTLNNTGPFRHFLYDSLRDEKPIDRMVTELLMLRGSKLDGGSAGFGIATDNDAPMASRSIVAASAFLGVNLQCARCHDAPYHSSTQKDLFSLAAMMSRKPVTVPPTSTVSPGFFEKHEGRPSLIEVTLKPGQPVPPQWTLTKLLRTSPTADGQASESDAESTIDPEDVTELLEPWVRDPADTRQRLAACVTAPVNSRFARVIVNRLWKQLIGCGIVQPVDDWEKGGPSHPELLKWLAEELIRHDYDAKHVIALIMKSDLYQRQAIGENLESDADERLFLAPQRRRLTAEQIVDSMVAASGRPLDVEPLSIDADGRRGGGKFLSLPAPSRAWMFTTLSNERDRPSLSLPRAVAVTDVMKAFGWTGSRQSAINQRDTEPNVLQAGSTGNSVFANWTTTASDKSVLADLAVAAESPRQLVETLYLRFLSRMPTEPEVELFRRELAEGFQSRIVPEGQRKPVVRPEPLEWVTWSNHLQSRANVIRVEQERRARLGDPADPRLQTQWRTRYEDFVWSLLNSPEFVWIP